MQPVKRLHTFMLQTFLPLFAMTFFIVLFIVLMQFLWKYIDDMVGKGLSIDVLGELFFYAAVSLVPMALPLAILLASLMTFGNLGEKLELTAMKASGISLLKVMAPLIVLIGGIAVGAFFFQNDVLPHAQVKMWTLLFSMKQKSPEVEIPPGVFYDQIPGYNIFVMEKDNKTGMLYEVMIYDVKEGGDNSTILRADSARMAFTKDMRYLYLHLFTGEQFENLRQVSSLDKNVPFRRESFEDKQLLMPFDANFNRLDDDAMRKQYVGKNIAELRHTIDSVGAMIDSVGGIYAENLKERPVVGVLPPRENETVNVATVTADLDSIMASLTPAVQRNVYSTAINYVTRQKNETEYKAMAMGEEKKNMRRHSIEMIKKFTLSVACLIFFFIGAPLGAIIRKGGLGTPLVISVFLFLVYYIIDNTGYKMARDGRWIVWMGMWLSTFILLPLGIYVTYKAMNDSAVFDKDAYLNRFRRLIGAKIARNVEKREVILNELPVSEINSRLEALESHVEAFSARYPKPQGYVAYWTQGIDMAGLLAISAEMEADIERLRDCRSPLVINKLMDYPVIRPLWIYHPTGCRWVAYLMMALLPIGAAIWWIGRSAQKSLKQELEKIVQVSGAIRAMVN